MTEQISGFKPRHARALAACMACACALLALVPTRDTGAGIEGTGFSRGRIAKFGSIFVNGVEFETTGATIVRDGQTAADTDLRLGEHVNLRGTVDASAVHGRATLVEFDDDVQGTIGSIDPVAGRLAVGGQVVSVDHTTVYGATIVPASISALTVGLRVRVSGLAGASGALVATRIDKLAAGANDELFGPIQSLDTARLTFSIRGVPVYYGAAASLPATLANGQMVDVIRAPTDATGPWRATRIEDRAYAANAAGDVAGLEGYVTRYTSFASFDVDGQRVVTTATTELRPRGAVVALNTLVEVDGVQDALGRIVARQVRVKAGLVNRIAAPVQSVDTASGTVRTLGLTLSTNAYTGFDDRSSQRARPFRLSDLRPGDWIDVRFPLVGAVDTLTRIDRATRVELQGVARVAATGALSLAGVTVGTSSQTVYADALDRPMTRAEFLRAANGRLARARVVPTTAGLQAERLALLP